MFDVISNFVICKSCSKLTTPSLHLSSEFQYSSSIPGRATTSYTSTKIRKMTMSPI